MATNKCRVVDQYFVFMRQSVATTNEKGNDTAVANIPDASESVAKAPLGHKLKNVRKYADQTVAKQFDAKNKTMKAIHRIL